MWEASSGDAHRYGDWQSVALPDIFNLVWTSEASKIPNLQDDVWSQDQVHKSAWLERGYHPADDSTQWDMFLKCRLILHLNLQTQVLVSRLDSVVSISVFTS